MLDNSLYCYSKLHMGNTLEGAVNREHGDMTWLEDDILIQQSMMDRHTSGTRHPTRCRLNGSVVDSFPAITIRDVVVLVPSTSHLTTEEFLENVTCSHANTKSSKTLRTRMGAWYDANDSTFALDRRGSLYVAQRRRIRCRE